MGALLILLPLLCVVLVNLPLGKMGDRLALPVGGALCLAQAALVVLAPASFWQQALPLGFGVSAAELFQTEFPVDSLARVMLLSIALVSFCAGLVARYSMANPRVRFRFGNLLILALAGLNGTILVRDLLGLYVFLEITAVASFVLIALDQGRAAFDGAFKYLVLSAVATAMIVAGLALLLIVAGSTSFSAVAAALQTSGSSQLARAAVGFFLCGLAIKAGLVPFHGWLPTAYASAPAAVSVLLAGVVTKTAGIYTLIRLVDEVFGQGPVVRQTLLVGGLLSILVGAVGALGQRDMKRMLAFSSISQMGYVILGLGAGPGLGMAGAIFHLFNHSIFKTLLFVNSAAVEQQTGTRNMDELGGIGARMPVTSATSILAMLSTAGIPPLSGFWSKLLIVVGVWKAGYPAFGAAAVIASVITLAYFLSMQRRVFFGKLAEGCADLREANAWALVPAVILATLTLGLGLGAPWLFDTFLVNVGSIL